MNDSIKNHPALIVVVGMAREAKIVSGEGVTVLIGGGQSARLARDLEQAIIPGAAGVVSFGLCGALHPDLDAGDVVVDSDDPEWLGRLRAAIPDAFPGRVLGGERTALVPDDFARNRCKA